jgi:hypothetical protein
LNTHTENPKIKTVEVVNGIKLLDILSIQILVLIGKTIP